jgi:hypothetical protein
VVRRPTYLRAFALVLGLPLLLLSWQAPADATTQSADQHRAPRTPLLVTIDSLSPGYVPERGPIRIHGRVTNRDDVPWTEINVHPFLADSGPIQGRAELAEAAATPADASVGTRLTDALAQIGELQPGASSTFSITVPRSVLEDVDGFGAPGIYWFGVHALGTGTDGRDDFADGRARTFLPLVPPSTRGAARTALVVPLRRNIGHEPDGSLSDAEAWQRTLSEGGRLREAVEFGSAAGPGQISWLVDPALPDAVARLAAGNPRRSLADTILPTEPGETLSPSPTDGDEEEDGQDDTEEEPPTAEQKTAAAWLTELEQALRSQELLTLPYGDLDVAAAADHDPALIDLARTQVGVTLTEWGMSGSPVVGSPSGFIDVGAIDATDDAAPVLITDRAFLDEAPGVASLDGRKLIVASSGAAAGGPAPGDPYASVALRQRILSEAALRVLEPGRRDPLVVVLPVQLTSDGAGDFFAGLDADWLDLTTVSDATDRNGRPIEPGDLVYPARQETFELDPETFQAVNDLVASGETLQNLLTLNDHVAAEVTDQALTGASYAARASQQASRASLNRSRGWIDDRLRSVEIGAPPGVTLSSASGDFVATITNRLNHTVTVSVQARSGNGIEVTPPEPVELGPRSRTSVLLEARTPEAAVHNVTLLLTDSEGTPLGSSDRLPIRSAQVSDVIWVIMGTGVLLLFGAIIVRLVRRIRRHRRDGRDPTPTDEPAPTTTGTSP